MLSDSDEELLDELVEGRERKRLKLEDEELELEELEELDEIEELDKEKATREEEDASDETSEVVEDREKEICESNEEFTSEN